MIKLAEITHIQQLQKHDIPRNTPEQRGERSLQGKLQDTGKKINWRRHQMTCAWTRINIVKTDYITKSNLLSQCDFIKTPMTFFTELKKKY